MRHLASVASHRRALAIGLVFGSVLILLFLSTLMHDVRARLPALVVLKWPDMVGGNLQTIPPTYDKIIQEEKDLPQHNLSLPFPEGKHGRYVKFSNQIKNLGWNNVLNEMYAPVFSSVYRILRITMAAFFATTWLGVQIADTFFKITSGSPNTIRGAHLHGRRPIPRSPPSSQARLQEVPGKKGTTHPGQ